MRNETRKSVDGQRGSAVVIAIFVLVLLAAMGTALLFLSQTEMKMSKAGVRVKEAFYLAEAGLEDGRRTLFDDNSSGDFDTSLDAAAGSNDAIELDVANLQPTYDTNGKISGFSGTGDDKPVRGLTKFGDGHYAAFLTNDPLETPNGRKELNDTNNRVMLTAIGVGPSGAVETVEAILEIQTAIPAIPPAALTLFGDSPHYESGQSSTSAMIGDDCTGSGDYAPVVGTFSDSAEAAAEAGYYKDKQGNDNGPVLKSGSYNTKDSTFANLNDSTEPTMATQPPIDPAWNKCSTLQKVLDDLRQEADHYCNLTGKPGCSLPTGTFGPSDIIFIDGDLELGNGDGPGAGILVVTGHLQYRGDVDWDGVVMVVGEGSMERNGGGSGMITGSTMVANIAGPDGVYGNSDDCTGSPDGFGQAHYLVQGGGNANVQYCSTSVDSANPVETYRVVEFLQH